MNQQEFERHPVGEALTAFRQKAASDFTDPQYQGQRFYDFDAGFIAACRIVQELLK